MTKKIIILLSWITVLATMIIIFSFSQENMEDSANTSSSVTEEILEIVLPKEETGSNTYVVNDMKPVINTVKNCAETIEKYGFKVEIEEFDLESEYKVTFTIKK